MMVPAWYLCPQIGNILPTNTCNHALLAEQNGGKSTWKTNVSQTFKDKEQEVFPEQKSLWAKSQLKFVILLSLAEGHVYQLKWVLFLMVSYKFSTFLNIP